jgi:hypothetical protein
VERDRTATPAADSSQMVGCNERARRATFIHIAQDYNDLRRTSRSLAPSGEIIEFRRPPPVRVRSTSDRPAAPFELLTRFDAGQRCRYSFGAGFSTSAPASSLSHGPNCCCVKNTGMRSWKSFGSVMNVHRVGRADIVTRPEIVGRRIHRQPIGDDGQTTGSYKMAASP